VAALTPNDTDLPTATDQVNYLGLRARKAGILNNPQFFSIGQNLPDGIFPRQCKGLGSLLPCHQG